jgi:hypothetical protein
MTTKLVRFLLIVTIGAALPARAQQDSPIPPPTARSLYVHPVSPDPRYPPNAVWTSMSLRNEGFEEGCRSVRVPVPQNQLLILDFGTPSTGVDIRGRSRRGWRWRGNGRYLDPEVVVNLAESYAIGWMDAHVQNQSFQDGLILCIGANNFDHAGNGQGYVDAAHGAEMAWVLHEFNARMAARGWRGVITGAIGADIEGCYGSPERTREWIDALAVANPISNPLAGPYVDYGDAAGCPRSGSNGTAAACNTLCERAWQQANAHWTQEDVRYCAQDSWLPVPIPQIYSNGGGNARQWQQLSLYSYLCTGARMQIGGPLTQSDACVQRPAGCVDVDNTAVEGWSQLRERLQEDWRTYQTLMFSTDIMHADTFHWAVPSCT